MPNVDFAQIKTQISIVDIAFKLLGLTLPKTGTNKDGHIYHKGNCPICKSDTCFTVTTSKGWYCHGRCKTGGDQIKLVAAVRGIPPRDAALLIQEHFMNGSAAPRAPKE